MKVRYENSMEYQALQLMEKSHNRVFLRQDFDHLGSYRQISRVLKKLINQGQLVKIGFGIYVKAYQSTYLNEPLIQGGFDHVSREALDRLEVQWEPGTAEQAYNTGETQQIPVQNVIRLKSRFRRKLVYAKRKLYFEGNINAK